jgi:DNA-binding transcriptional ArsR family regulator
MEDFSNEAYYLFFSTLASRTRLAMIDVLREKPKSLAEISDVLKQKQEVLAQNLERLEHCALVQSEESDGEKLYSVNKEIIEPLSGLLSFHASKHCPGLTECIPQEKLKEYMKQEAAKVMYIGHE